MSGLYDGAPESPSFDESKYKLGKLCKRGHDWMGTGKSLCTIKGRGRCRQCARERYLENLDENRQKAKVRMQNNRKLMTSEELRLYRQQALEYQRSRIKQQGRKSRSKVFGDFIIPPQLAGTGCTADDIKPFADANYPLDRLMPTTVIESRKLWYHLKNMEPAPTVAELVENEAKNAWSAEKIEFIENGGTEEEWRKELDRRHHHHKMATDPDYVLYHRQKSKRRKAQMRNSVAVQASGKQIRARFAEFDHRCAYCGADGDLHIEHVVPISKGGPHAIGNIIPACKRCNFSKRDHDAESWYRQQSFFSETRWRKICRVLGWGRSSVGQLALL